MKTLFKNYTVTASPLRMLCTVLCWVLLSLQAGYAQQENKVILSTQEGEEELNTREVQSIRFRNGSVILTQPWGQTVYNRTLRGLTFFRPLPGHVRLTATATIGSDSKQRRALGLDGEGKIRSTWDLGDQVYVYAEEVGNNCIGILTPLTPGAATSTLVGDIDASGLANGATLYMSTKDREGFTYASQEGTLSSLFYATAQSMLTINGGNATMSSATFTNPQSITKFAMKKGTGDAVAVKSLAISGGGQNITVNLASASNEVFVALPANGESTAYSFTAIDTENQIRTGTLSANVQNGKYYRADLTVKLTPAVTAPVANTLNYNGQAQTLISAATAPGGTVSYKLAGGAYSESLPQATAIGNYTVYYKVAGDADHHDVAEASIPASIGRGIGTVSFENAAISKTIIEGSYTETVNKVGDGTVTYAVTAEDPSGTVTVNASSGTVSIYKAGTATITATVADGTNYDYAVNTASYTLTVNKAAGNIAYTTTEVNKTYGDANFTNELLKSAGSDGTVTYSVPNNNGVATINSSTGEVTIIGAGSTTVTATVADGANWTFAQKTVTYTLNVAKATPNITLSQSSGSVYRTLTTSFTASVANAGSYAYNGTLSVSSSSESIATATISNGTVTVTGVGEGDATITVTAGGNANWNSATKTYGIHVEAKAPSSVTTAPTAQDRTYTGSAQTLLNNVGVASGGTLYYKTTETNSMPASKDGFSSASSGYSQTNAKTYYVWYYIKGDASHLDSEIYGPVTATISKANPTYTAPSASSPTYNGNAQYLVTTGSTSHGTIYYATSQNGTYSTTRPTGTNAQNYTVWYKLTGDANHNDVSATQVSNVKINPKTVSSPAITLGTTSYTYDGYAKTPSVSSVKDGSTTISSSEYTVSYSNNTNAGTATVTISDNSGGNYTVSGSKTFTINPKTMSITAKDQTKTYGTSISNSTSYITSSNLVSGHSVSSITLTPSTTNVPGGTITPSNAVIRDGSNNVVTSNYDITYYTGTLTINKANSTFSCSDSAISFSSSEGSSTTKTRKVSYSGGTYTISGSNYSFITATGTSGTITFTRRTTDEIFIYYIMITFTPDANHNAPATTSVTIPVTAAKYVDANGHAYVDLGNPDLYYATMNIGASSPTEYGSYFAWGETFTASGNFDKEHYSASSISSDLSLSDDAARVKWRGSWRMPTKAELQWLIDNCTWTWDSSNKGYTITSKISGYTSNSIFLPAAGQYVGSSFEDAGSVGHYWTSTYKETSYAWHLFFGKDRNTTFYDDYRWYGKTIRPVLNK